MRRGSKARHHGVLLVDKPSGITSHDVVLAVRRRLRQHQVGHGGTLDPLASGLLPVLLGQATKLSTWVTETDKAYRVTALLGVETDTQDAEGQVVASAPVPDALDAEAMAPVLRAFTGSQQQRVPRYAAVKKDGKRLYELARAGEVVEPPVRRVTVHRLELVSLALPQVTLDVVCSKGTYVRALVSDLGAHLGCGAHVTALRRTSVGSVSVREATALEGILSAPQPETLIVPPAAWLRRFVPCLTLTEALARRVRHGQRPDWRQLRVMPLPAGARFALLGPEQSLVAIAESLGDRPGCYALRRVFPPVA